MVANSRNQPQLCLALPREGVAGAGLRGGCSVGGQTAMGKAREGGVGRRRYVWGMTRILPVWMLEDWVRGWGQRALGLLVGSPPPPEGPRLG